MNTVTISLIEYEEMKRKIERLEKEVQQKTIIKYSAHETVLALAALIVFLGITIFAFLRPF